jgi:hypothetical protein
MSSSLFFSSVVIYVAALIGVAFLLVGLGLAGMVAYRRHACGACLGRPAGVTAPESVVPADAVAVAVAAPAVQVALLSLPHPSRRCPCTHSPTRPPGAHGDGCCACPSGRPCCGPDGEG